MSSKDQNEKKEVTNEPKHREEITITTNVNPIQINQKIILFVCQHNLLISFLNHYILSTYIYLPIYKYQNKSFTYFWLQQELTIFIFWGLRSLQDLFILLHIIIHVKLIAECEIMRELGWSEYLCWNFRDRIVLTSESLKRRIDECKTEDAPVLQSFSTKI